jgi:predicted ATPase/DNA-binding XRE family transcriptional regulator
MAQSLASLFKQLRARAGLSQEQLAERAGLSHRTVGDIESGVRRRRRAVTLRLLAGALGLTAAECAALLHTAVVEGLETPGETGVGRRLPDAPVLLGRDAAVADLRERLLAREAAFVTLTGPPGVGKTATALRCASEIAERFRGGAAFVALDTIADAASVLPLIARTLGLDERDRGAELHALIADRLRAAPALLVLDNIEHVLDAGTDVATLLRQAPETTVLATGRSPFNLTSETEVRLPPLAPADAAALFLERAQSIVPAFQPDAAERGHIDRICASLEGLPLAIELAALRTRSFGPAQLANDMWELLAGGPRDASPRHQALDAAIGWSYDLLDPPGRLALARFSVFAGGATAAAAEAVCGMPAIAIDALVRQNLLVVEGLASARRLRVLVPIREFLAARLREADEVERTGERHAEYFGDVARRLAVGPAPALREALETFDAERSNLYAALAWCRDANRWQLGTRTARALSDLWRLRAAYAEAAAWFEGFAAAGARDGSDDRRRWEAIDGAVHFNSLLGRHDRARSYAVQAAEVARSLGDPAVDAWTLTRSGLVEFNLGNIADAIALQERALAIADPIDDDHLRGYVHHACAIAFLEDGRLQKATHHLHLSLRHSRAAGRDMYVASGLLVLCECYTRQHDYPSAQAFASRALELAEAIGYATMIAKVRLADVELALVAGDSSRARADLIAIFEFLCGTHEPETLIGALLAAALYFTTLERHREAALLHGLWQHRLGRHSEFPAERAQSAAEIARLSAALDAARIDEYLQIGRALSIEDVLDLLREVEE